MKIEQIEFLINIQKKKGKTELVLSYECFKNDYGSLKTIIEYFSKNFTLRLYKEKLVILWGDR